MFLDPSQDVPCANKPHLDSGCAVPQWSILGEKKRFNSTVTSGRALKDVFRSSVSDVLST